MSLPFTKHDIALNIQGSHEDCSHLSTMSCAICIVEDDFHDRFSAVRRCVAGTMRCQEHKMQCANCKQEVDTDAQLLCFACSDSGQGSVFHEKLTKKPTPFFKKCYFAKNKEDSIWACGCAKCMEITAQFYLARAIEEGYASSLASPKTPKSDEERTFMAFGS